MENSRSEKGGRRSNSRPRGWWKVGEREKSARPWMERSFPVRSRSADIGCRTSPSTDLFAFNYVLRWLLANCLPLPAHYLSRTTERSCRDALRSKSRLKGNYTIQGFLSVKKKKKKKDQEHFDFEWFRISTPLYHAIHAILSDLRRRKAPRFTFN